MPATPSAGQPDAGAAVPQASGAEAPQLSEEEAAEIDGALGVEEGANPTIEFETQGGGTGNVEAAQRFRNLNNS